MTRDEFVAKYFPEVSPGRMPLGNKITVQLMYFPKKHSSGLILAAETQDFNKNATIVCRVVAVGPIAYRDRSSGDTWKEGAWCGVGDIVLMPRYGGMNRTEFPHPDDPEESVIFATYNDYDALDLVTDRFEHYTKLL